MIKVYRLHEKSDEIVVPLAHLRETFIRLFDDYYSSLGMTTEEGWEDFWRLLTEDIEHE